MTTLADNTFPNWINTCRLGKVMFDTTNIGQSIIQLFFNLDKGRVGIFAGSWYSSPIHDRIDGILSKAALDQRIDQINRFASRTREGFASAITQAAFLSISSIL